MKLNAPSDLMGGLLIFGLAIAMFFVMRLIAKPMALRSSGYGESDCKKLKGRWNYNGKCCNFRAGTVNVPKGFPVCVGMPFP